jgi:patatin-related protein
VAKEDGRSGDGSTLNLRWDELYAGDRQEVRIAVVMIGGVSLAIWIGGVTLELQHLDLASRNLAQRGARGLYEELLDFMHCRARIDVIAGTSAGGVNGGFLALGAVHGCDLCSLGGVWENEGALRELFRSPLQKGPPSLLRGDDYFLEKLKDAYGAFRSSMLTGSTAEHPVELFLTTTLFTGKQTTFTDDLGRPIEDTEYTGTFAFGNTPAFGDGCGDLGDPRVLDQLATASRCTSSFPGAFEPHWVEVDTAAGQGADARWRSVGGRASFDVSQYVVDGGVLLNKPIRPALEAIYRQPAQEEVRRVLAYVVPDPGKLSNGSQPSVKPEVPVATDVILAMATKLRTADSVSHELEEIRTRNQRARDRRDARTRIVATLLDGPDSSGENSPTEEAWSGYRRVRARVAGLTIGQIVAGAGREWSAAEIASAVARQPRLPFIPADAQPAAGQEWKHPVWLALERRDDAWDWGLTTVERLGALAIDLLKRAMWLAPMEANDADASSLRARIRDARGRLHDILRDLRQRRQAIEEFWRCNAPRDAGARGAAAALERRAQLDGWLGPLLETWRQQPPVPNRELYRAALALAGRLRSSAADLQRVCRTPNPRLDPDGGELRRLERPVKYLHLVESATDEAVLQRMLQLDVVQLAFTGASDDIEQEVELVEITAAVPAPDGRVPAVHEKLTGMQLGHFGAFYRRSWRVNDWLWGRIDGVGSLAETLLSPGRLRQLGSTPAEALAGIERLAVGADGPDQPYLQQQWQEVADACRIELACLDDPQPPPTLPSCARAVARRLQTEVLRVELPRLAEAIERERIDETPVPSESLSWLQDFRRDVPPAATTPGAPSIPAPVLWKHFAGIDRIGKARIDQDVGSDLFARTASTGAAVLASVLSAGPDLKHLRPVRSVLQGFRGYALGLWSLVHLTTGRSRVGLRMVSLAVPLGTALLALSLVAPGFPGAIAVVGLLIMLAGLTTALLLHEQSAALRRRVRRLAFATVSLVAIVALVGWRYHDVMGPKLGWLRAWTPSDNVMRALVVIVAMAIMAYIGSFDLPPPPAQKPPDPPRGAAS